VQAQPRAVAPSGVKAEEPVEYQRVAQRTSSDRPSVMAGRRAV